MGGIKRIEANIDVVEAAKRRTLNVFKNGLPIYLAFSGGKDTLCMAHIVYQLIRQGKIDPKQLTCYFIDEEAIYPCLEQTVLEWREKFLKVGAKFDWYAIEVKHYNCFRSLETEETFICFDRYLKDRWVRQPPDFAIRSHPLLQPRKDAYQDFCSRIFKDGITLIGIRVAESVQRLYYYVGFTKAKHNITKENIIWPIYDWRDSDVWLYLLENKIDFPEAYVHMWQIGRSKKELRISQFFSTDTAGSLVRLNEYYPDLMDRITRREPGAYLAAMYWDSEMFKRHTKKRREMEGNQSDNKDYRALALVMLNDIPRYFDTPAKRDVAAKYRKNIVMQYMEFLKPYHWREVYETLLAGDPKLRKMRAMMIDIPKHRKDMQEEKHASLEKDITEKD